ncbi:hypothetical protein ACFX15_028541 [Malus domestica]
MSGGRPMAEKESTMSGILPNYHHPHHHHLVLIHGIGHGAWCWYKIRCLMEASGYKVTCLDLKGAGVDQSDPNTVLTFQDYNQPLTDFLSSLPGNERVILVGHSAGGMSLTDAIHRFASKIHMAIYVAATMLEHGFSTHQDIIDVRILISSIPFFFLLKSSSFLRKVLRSSSAILCNFLVFSLYLHGKIGKLTYYNL